jgi:hypothetical protein
MNKLYSVALALFVLLTLGCNDRQTQEPRSRHPSQERKEIAKDTMVMRFKISTPYDHVDAFEIPEVVPFSYEQKLYISEVFLAYGVLGK